MDFAWFDVLCVFYCLVVGFGWFGCARVLGGLGDVAGLRVLFGFTVFGLCRAFSWKSGFLGLFWLGGFCGLII